MIGFNTTQTDPNDPEHLTLPGENPDNKPELSDDEKIKKIESDIDSDKINHAVAEYFTGEYETLADYVLTEYVKEKYPGLYKQVLLEDFSDRGNGEYNLPCF